MDYPSIFLYITLVNLLAWITPGPNMFAVINASLTQGRTFGLLTGVGLSAGATLWATFAVFGVDVLFEHFPDLVFTLRLLGASYLTWLGLKSLHSLYSRNNAHLGFEHKKQSKPKALLNGLLVSMSNPKAALFFGSILTTFVPENASPSLLFSIVILCGALAIICHSITATVFSVELIARHIRRYQRSISAVMGLAFTGLGLGFAIDAFRNRINS